MPAAPPAGPELAVPATSPKLPTVAVPEIPAAVSPAAPPPPAHTPGAPVPAAPEAHATTLPLPAPEVLLVSPAPPVLPVSPALPVLLAACLLVPPLSPAGHLPAVVSPDVPMLYRLHLLSQLRLQSLRFRLLRSSLLHPSLLHLSVLRPRPQFHQPGVKGASLPSPQRSGARPGP